MIQILFACDVETCCKHQTFKVQLHSQNNWTRLLAKASRQGWKITVNQILQVQKTICPYH